jgi:hypothetical protein
VKKNNRPKSVACGLWFPKGVTQPGSRFAWALPIFSFSLPPYPILPISYPPYPLPAGSQFARGKTGHYTGKTHSGNCHLLWAIVLRNMSAFPRHRNAGEKNILNTLFIKPQVNSSAQRVVKNTRSPTRNNK